MALALQNYALLQKERGKLDKAEANLKGAIAIYERLYGPKHSAISPVLNTLVHQYIEQQRWPDALDAARRAATIAQEFNRLGNVQAASLEGQAGSSFRRLAQAAYSSDPSDPSLMNEGFVAAQRALETEASIALSQLGARYASGQGELPRLLRERQDLIGERKEHDKRLIDSAAKPPSQRDGSRDDKIKARIVEIDNRLEEIDVAVGKKFPQYASLSNPSPISVGAVQALLRPDEALLQFLDVQAVGGIKETAFAWLITKTDARWVRLDLGTAALERAVETLRCGVDAARWQSDGGKACNALLNLSSPAAPDPLPFDFGVAHKLHQALLAPFETQIKGRHLIVIPSGALTRLPLSMLVAEPPSNPRATSLNEYKSAAWLGARQAMSVLPAAASLQALRKFAKHGRAEKPYLGIGNPLLDGDPNDAFDAARARSAREQQKCSGNGKPLDQDLTRVTHKAVDTRGIFLAARQANVRNIRRQAPLPETRDELCTVAKSLGVHNADQAVLLGSRATEGAIKSMSKSGQLERFQILHFATHGVLPNEAEAYLNAAAEPGLILTPPGTPDGTDDGLLTASENLRTQTQCGMGCPFCVQYRRRCGEQCGAALWLGPCIFLRWHALASCFALGCRFQCGGTANDPCICGAQSVPEDRPR